eukprot:m.478694 g.478694  ORF g.478694 m.478694 type:complete len:105 (-) comp21694_c0_seq20:1176-1490(-)
MLLLSRNHVDKNDEKSPIGTGLQEIGDFIRSLNTIHREYALEVSRLSGSLQTSIKSPHIAQARAALEKSTRRFDKEKHKKRGSLALRSLSLEYVLVRVLSPKLV